MGTSFANVVDELQRYGIIAQIQGNKVIIIYPRQAIEQKIFEEITKNIDPAIRNKINVKANGDVVVEVVL